MLTIAHVSQSFCDGFVDVGMFSWGNDANVYMLTANSIHDGSLQEGQRTGRQDDGADPTKRIPPAPKESLLGGS